MDKQFTSPRSQLPLEVQKQLVLDLEDTKTKHLTTAQLIAFRPSLYKPYKRSVQLKVSRLKRKKEDNPDKYWKDFAVVCGKKKEVNKKEEESEADADDDEDNKEEIDSDTEDEDITILPLRKRQKTGIERQQITRENTNPSNMNRRLALYDDDEDDQDLTKKGNFTTILFCFIMLSIPYLFLFSQ